MSDPLNEAQRRAVAHRDGPLLVNAGPGSGKTRVVTARAAKLIASGVRPEDLLLVTFTNKAAGEMKSRLRAQVGADAVNRLWVGTFHSICARILRRLRQDDQREGRRADFSIYDDKDTLALVKRAVVENQRDPKTTDPQEIRSWISWRKNGGGDWPRAEGDVEPRFMPEDLVPETEQEELWRKIWVHYDRLLVGANAFDFDDLLGVMMRLVEGGTALGRGICSRWSHVVVDEYQDTNEVQFRLVRALSSRRNLCVVGDHRQAIYGFRGANYRNILLFEERYPDAEVVSLDTNYRSDGNIVLCFNALFSDSRMKPAGGRPLGKKIEVAGCLDEEHEASAVCGRIATALDMGVPPSEIAVLYRVHALSRAVEERLRNNGVKYQVVGGLSFYERRVVKDALAYVRLVTNPHSDVDVDRVINVPPRAIGDPTVNRLHVLAAERRCSLWEAIPALVPSCTPKTARGLQNFQLLIKHAQEDLASKKDGLAGVVENLINRSGYRQRLTEEMSKRQGKLGDEDRRERPRKGRVAKEVVEAEKAEQDLLNLDQVVSAVEAYEGRVGEPTLQGYLEEVALITDQDELKDGAVSLMTVHAAKGLEYQYVFVVGVESGIFPFVRAEDLSEELRLLFVAVSRAKRSLCLTYARSRRTFGQVMTKEPSRFLERIPLDLIEPAGDYRHFYNERVRAHRTRGTVMPDLSGKELLRELRSQGFDCEPTANNHYKIKAPNGQGSVVHISLDSGDPRAIKNSITQLRRIGFVAPWDDTPSSRKPAAPEPEEPSSVLSMDYLDNVLALFCKVHELPADQVLFTRESAGQWVATIPDQMVAVEGDHGRATSPSLACRALVTSMRESIDKRIGDLMRLKREVFGDTAA